jgi:predicted Ser/Thr protein kinase
MTREEVMEMAYESGMIAGYEGEPDLLERFAALVAAAERKRLLDAAECCRMCEQKGIRHDQTKGYETD